MFNNRLQTATSLKRRGWKGSEFCCVCGKKETVNHIFFQCVLATFTWSVIRESFGWVEHPRSLADLAEGCFKQNLNMPAILCLFIFAGLSWAMWCNRNKMAIERVFPNKPIDSLLKDISCLQSWKILLKEGDKERLDPALDHLVACCNNLQTSAWMPSDVVEL